MTFPKRRRYVRNMNLVLATPRAQDGSSCRLSSLFRVSRRAPDTLRTHISCFAAARENWRCEQKCKPTPSDGRGSGEERMRKRFIKRRRIISLGGRTRRINFASKHAARSQGIAASDDAHRRRRRRRQFYSTLLIHPVQKTRPSPISHCSFIPDVNELITARGRVSPTVSFN